MAAVDELHIIGILDENLVSSVIKAEDLRALICDYLQIGPYYPVLVEVLDQQGVSVKEEAKIDLQAVFKALKTAYFSKNIPSYYNNRTTKYSIKLLKAALITYTRSLLTMIELRDGANVHQLKEFESLSTGVPCTIEAIHSMLWVIKKTISNSVLTKWINAHAKFYDQPGTLMVHEFIYLICNCTSKPEMLDKIPKVQMNIKREYKTNLFYVDKDFSKTYETPDHKIQHFMGTMYNYEKVYIEGLSSPQPNNMKNTLKNNKKQASNVDQNQEDEVVLRIKDLFRKQLRSMVLTVGVKMKLKEYHQKLIRSRLNGKTEYDKLVGNGFEESIPKAFNQTNQSSTKAKRSPNFFKNTEIQIGRPQTAQNRPTSAFNKTNGFKSTNLNARKLSYTASPKALLLPESRVGNGDIRSPTRPAQNLKVKAKFSSMSQSNMPLMLVNKREECSQFTPLSTQDSELLNMFENIIDEEYGNFEMQSKIDLDRNQKRAKSIAFFNSTSVSPNNTRIYSSKPGSPKVAVSLSAKKFY